MGLTMYVGAYAALGDGTVERNDLIREGLQEIYDLLEQNGITPHEEAVQYAEGPGLWTCDVRHGVVGDFQDFVADLQRRGLIDVSDEQLVHLVEHSAGAGYYLPIDFKPFIATEDLHLGSSPQLKQICQKVMEYLEFPLPLEQIPFDYSGDGDELWKIVNNLKGKGGRWTSNIPMTLICLMLYQGSELSIRNSMILGFS